MAAAPTPQYNFFDLYMLTSSRVMMIKRKISDHHGRIENIKLFDIDPQHIWKEEEEKRLADAQAKKEMAQKAAAA